MKNSVMPIERRGTLFTFVFYRCSTPAATPATPSSSACTPP